MEHQSTDPAAHPDARRAAASQAPLQALRWTLLRRVRTHQRKDHVADQVDDQVDEACDVKPQIVGVRDQASGQAHIFTVYGAPTGVTQGVEPPPDPDPPPSAPAQARQPAGWSDSDEADPGTWPHARAA